ncbi:MAG: DUF2156 domain-containing protein [Myxococcales bacterium]|nr:DUF2156 domain-containing protein [Myxococcales bacterium]
MKDLGLISMEHRDIALEALAAFPPIASEQTFTNLYAWKESHPVGIISDSKNGLIFYADHGEFMSIYGAPLGNIELGDAATVIQKISGKPVIAAERIPHNIAIRGFERSDDRANHDYVYMREELASLSGNRFHAKKNLLNQCLENYECSYEEIGSENLSEVTEFMKRWCESRKCGTEPGLCHEYRAIRTILENYDSFPVTGAAIRIYGKVEAFTIGEKLNSETAVIHFEKASGNFKGLYQLVNNWFAKNHLAEFKFVNREQDLGIEGLRKAKESYNPHHMVEKSNVFFSKDAHARLKAQVEKRCGDVGA